MASAGGGTGSGWIRGRRGRREESRTASRRCRTGCKVVPFSRGPACGKESFRVGAVGADPGRCVGRVESGVPRSYPLRCGPDGRARGSQAGEAPWGSHTRGWPCADASIRARVDGKAGLILRTSTVQGLRGSEQRSAFFVHTKSLTGSRISSRFRICLLKRREKNL